VKYPIDPIQKYCAEFSSPQSEILKHVEKETFLKTVDPFNYSGHLQGRILSMLSRMIKPKNILELGSFTGYSAICLAEGLHKDGQLLTIEINPEVEFLLKKSIVDSNHSESIRYIIGDAIDIMPRLTERFDLIFIDAAKREYESYYELSIDLLDSNGFLIVDNVLWKNKIIGGQQDSRTNALRIFNTKVLEDSRVENVILPMLDGMQLIRKI